MGNKRMFRMIVFQSVKQKTIKDCNWDNQGKRQSSKFNKSANGSYRPVVKPKKKVEAPPMKTGSWLGRKVDSSKTNVVYSLETKLHYFDRDDMECSY
ncbi:hypothetical protein Tco_0262976 [Tanacetum coccineum]